MVSTSVTMEVKIDGVGDDTVTMDVGVEYDIFAAEPDAGIMEPYVEVVDIHIPEEARDNFFSIRQLTSVKTYRDVTTTIMESGGCYEG